MGQSSPFSGLEFLYNRMMSNFDWAGWIKTERLKRGWNQNAMALRSNIPHWQTTLFRVEAGKQSTTLRTVIIVARLFEMSPAQVMKVANAPFVYPADTIRLNALQLGETVWMRRKGLRISREKFGKQIGVSGPGIYFMERNFPRVIPANIVLSIDRVLSFEGELIGLAWAFIENELG